MRRKVEVAICSLSPFVIRAGDKEIEVSSRIIWCEKELSRLHELMEELRKGKCTVEEFEKEVKSMKGCGLFSFLLAYFFA
jgi:hypothetical protein